ncbi:MAG: hypothetical protein Q7J82_09205 [Coriobacteriia bacterium]|nr:hypothetical protein [Coriobacteriia bacterium]
MSDEVFEVRPALQAARHELLARPNVVATGVGYKVSDGVRTGEIGIVCSVTHKVPRSELRAQELVPETVGGFRTDVVATGPFRTLAARPERYRPALGGVSIGHRDITAGTLGCIVYRNGEPFILSNNHVLANENLAALGDPILQPGPYDGGRLPGDAIGVLADYVAVRMAEEESGCAFARNSATVLNWLAGLTGSGARLRAVSTAMAENLVDCALAAPLDASYVSEEILDLGHIEGIGRAELGAAVIKSGRTTEVTRGEIVQVDVTADVNFGDKVARFTDQLMAGPMSEGGDSGSVVLDDRNRIVGLLFAGSESTTLFNRIENVFSALEVGLR